MPTSLGVWLVTALLAMFLGLVSIAFFRRVWLWNWPRTGKTAPTPTYTERMALLTEHLADVSSEMDVIMQEMQRLAEERQQTIMDLERTVYDLETEAEDMQERISALKDVPLPAIDYLTRLMEPSERKAVLRDWLIFVLGLVAAVVLQGAAMLITK